VTVGDECPPVLQIGDGGAEGMRSSATGGCSKQYLISLSPSMGVALLAFGPDPHLAGVPNLDVKDVWSAADRTIPNVFLAPTCRQIDRDDNLLAT
jgi:hypothetical protein